LIIVSGMTKSLCGTLQGIGSKERLKRWVLRRFLEEQSVTAPTWRSTGA